MLLSTQQSGILVGTDKIFLFLEDSDKTSVGKKEYLFSLQIILSEIYIFALSNSGSLQHTSKEFWFSHWSSLCSSWALQSEKFQGTVRWSTFFQWRGTHFLNFLSLFWQHTASHKGPGIKLVPPAVEVCSHSHWTAKKVPGLCFLFLLFTFLSLADFMIEILCKEFDHTSIYLSILL